MEDVQISFNRCGTGVGNIYVPRDLTLNSYYIYVAMEVESLV